MALVPMKCPECGGNLDFDVSRDFMFCSFCGAKIIRDDVFTANINVNNEKEIRSNLEIGRDAFLHGNYLRAKECAERALLLDSHIADGWLLLASVAKLENDKSKEIEYISKYESNVEGTINVISKDLYSNTVCCYVEVKVGKSFGVAPDIKMDDEIKSCPRGETVTFICQPGKHTVSWGAMGMFKGHTTFDLKEGTKRFEVAHNMFGTVKVKELS